MVSDRPAGVGAGGAGYAGDLNASRKSALGFAGAAAIVCLAVDLRFFGGVDWFTVAVGLWAGILPLVAAARVRTRLVALGSVAFAVVYAAAFWVALRSAASDLSSTSALVALWLPVWGLVLVGLAALASAVARRLQPKLHEPRV